jgi:hypothetical protein
VVVFILFLINQNLLLNPSFEEWNGDSILYWKIAHPNALPCIKETDTVYNGNFSVKIIRSSPTTGLKDALISDKVFINGGTYYYFGAYFWDNDSNIYAKIQINWYKDGNYIGYADSPNTQNLNGWQFIWNYKKAPDTANQAVFKIRIYPVDTLPRTGFCFCDFAFLSTSFEIKEKISFDNKDFKEFKIFSVFNLAGQRVKFLKNKKGIYFIKDGKEIKKLINF